MTLGIPDGVGTAHTGSGTSLNVTLSTAFINDIIILQFSYNVAQVTGTTVSDTAGLNWIKRTVATRANSTTEEWFAVSLNVLTNDVVTASTASTTAAISLVVFGITNAYTISQNPYDTNSSLPATNTGTSTLNPSISGISTNYLQTVIILLLSTPGSPTVTLPAGFTQINITIPTGPTAVACYQIVNTPQSNLTETFTLGTSEAFSIVGDAIVAVQLLVYIIQQPI